MVGGKDEWSCYAQPRTRGSLPGSYPIETGVHQMGAEAADTRTKGDVDLIILLHALSVWATGRGRSLPKPPPQKKTTKGGLSRSLLPSWLRPLRRYKDATHTVQCPNCQVPLARLMTLLQKTLCCCPYSNQLLQIAGDWWSPTPGSLQSPQLLHIEALQQTHTATEHTRSALELSVSCLFWTHWLVIYLSTASHIQSIFRAFQPTMCREMHRCTHLLY